MQSHPKKRVLLLSTVHSVTDPRIVGKIKPSLSTLYEVKCGLTEEPSHTEGTPIQGQYFKFRFYARLWQRLLWVHPRALWCFWLVRPHIVHIFVAELLPLAFVFRWLGAEIIYEVQENLYKKIPTKTYNRSWIFERLFHYFDHRARQRFYFVFTEDAYLKEYQALAKPFAVVHNYADITLPNTVSYKSSTGGAPTFFYAGVISFERGFDTMVAALAIVKRVYPDVCLKLFGHRRFSDQQLWQLPAYKVVKENLHFYGYVAQKEAFVHAQEALAGIVLLKPVGDYSDSYPTKLFDYMAIGLPVLTSDLPLLKTVVETHHCGFCISAEDAEALAEKMVWIIENPASAAKMGNNGQEAVIKYYNWASEQENLKRLYQLAL